MAKTDSRTKVKVNSALKEPPLFKVIYVNDDVTTMSFVVESLVSHFDYNHDTALHITEDIHEKGSATVAVLPFEIAEQKRIEVVTDARKAKFPLKVTLESEEH